MPLAQMLASRALEYALFRAARAGGGEAGRRAAHTYVDETFSSENAQSRRALRNIIDRAINAGRSERGRAGTRPLRIDEIGDAFTPLRQLMRGSARENFVAITINVTGSGGRQEWSDYVLVPFATGESRADMNQRILAAVAETYNRRRDSPGPGGQLADVTGSSVTYRVESIFSTRRPE